MNHLTIRSAVINRRMLVALAMGFSCGLPLLLTLSVLQAWMTEAGVDLTTIGLMTLVGLPYTLKFFWAPLFDRYRLPFLGRRRGWLLIAQLALMGSLIGLGFSNPVAQPELLALAALAVSFFSASQDIVVDAYRREDLPDRELGLGSSLYINGYRVGMLLASGGGLILADHIPYSLVYTIMACCLLPGVITTLLTPEPHVASIPQTLKDAVVAPLKEYFSRTNALWILAFILMYKIGDTMAAAMTTPFYLDIGFSKTQIGAVVKLFGFWATVGGTIFGGIAMIRLGIIRSLPRALFDLLDLCLQVGDLLLDVGPALGQVDLLLQPEVGHLLVEAGNGVAQGVGHQGVHVDGGAQLVDGDQQVLCTIADLCRGARGTLGQKVAKALALADHLGHLHHSVGVSKAEVDAAGHDHEHLTEGGDPDCEYSWVVDPLDGTREFIKRNGEFTVNIAFIDNGVPILSVVHVPVSGVSYLACQGQGAFKQEADGTREAIRVRKLGDGPVMVVGSRSHRGDSLNQFLERLGEHDMVGMGSSLKLCLVAEGVADIYPRLGPTSEWDTAAAQCVVEQAGGFVTDTDMKPLRYNTKDSLLNPFFLVFGDEDKAVLSQFPMGYQYLATIQTQAGYRVKRDMPGIDGEIVEKLYQAGEDWLNQGPIDITNNWRSYGDRS